MNIALFLSTLAGVFKFWDQITWLIKLLQKTPQEKHEELIKRMQKEAASYEETGRPTWDA